MCVCGFSLLPLICSLRLDSHLPNNFFFSRHWNLSPHLPDSRSLSDFLWAFFSPSSHLLCFFNSYINLFPTPALGLRAHIPFPQRCDLSLFISPLHFLICLSCHTVLVLLFLTLSVSYSRLLWLRPLSFSFCSSQYNFRIVGGEWSWNCTGCQTKISREKCIYIERYKGH